MWTRLNPVIAVDLAEYPPPSGLLVVSGLHCSIPNGVSAPGKT
jgi:hypothetical protein